jgi:hypothetical protein
LIPQSYCRLCQIKAAFAALSFSIKTSEGDHGIIGVGLHGGWQPRRTLPKQLLPDHGKNL